MKIMRQGDVLLVQEKSLPRNKSAASDQAPIVLAYGEVTGHAHRILDSLNQAKLWDAGAERYLQVISTVALTHEEHSALTIDPGIYRVVIQMEYTPLEIRHVED